MLLNLRRLMSGTLALGSVLLVSICVNGQNSFEGGRPVASVTTLDSSKEQDGLVGSVRRVQTESAKLHVKSGKLVEGRRQLLEMTTYDLKGERLDNISYPVVGSQVGREEYKYDEKGNIIEMTLRADDGSIISRETYSYELDKIGNWVKMVTNLLVFEEGELKKEPVEVTYRTITYYFDDAIAKIVDASPTPAQVLPQNSTNDTPPVVGESLAEQPVVSTEANKPVPVAVQPEPEARVIKELPKIEEEEPSLPAPVSASPPPRAGAEKAASVPAETRASLNLYEVGRLHLDGGNLKQAAEAFQGYLKLEPESARAYLDLGYTYSKLNKRREAIKALKQAINKNPNLEDAHYLLAVEYLRTNNFHDSAGSFKKALQLRSDMAQAHYGLALAYQELGKTDLVIQEYRTLQLLDAGLARKLAATFPDLTLVPCTSGPLCK